MVWYVMARYVMLCCAVLCYVMLCNVCMCACMYACNVCMYVMYVCNVCMYVMYAKQVQQPPDFGVLKAVKKTPQIDVFELRRNTFWSKRAQVAFWGSKK